MDVDNFRDEDTAPRQAVSTIREQMDDYILSCVGDGRLYLQNKYTHISQDEFCV